MQTLSRWLFLVLLLAGAAAPAAGPAAEPGIDLEKTRALLHSWVQRDSFPDSVTFAHGFAEALKLVDGSVAKDTRERAVAFIKRCQRPNGGFVSNPTFGDDPNIVYTYYALAALDRLGAGAAIDREKASRFVRGLIDTDGGVRPAATARHPATLASTFYGVEALRLLQQLDALDAEKTSAFVLTHRTADDGGFAVTRKGPSRPLSTSMAVRTLATLGTLTEQQKKASTGFLEGATALVGTKGPLFMAYSSMQAIAAMVAALERLSALGDVFTEPLVAFVTARYVPQNGGFGPLPGYGTTPPSTFQGLYCLHALGALPAAKAVP